MCFGRWSVCLVSVPLAASQIACDKQSDSVYNQPALLIFSVFNCVSSVDCTPSQIDNCDHAYTHSQKSSSDLCLYNQYLACVAIMPRNYPPRVFIIIQTQNHNMVWRLLF